MSSESPAWTQLLAVGAAAAALIAVGMLIGWALDSVFDTEPALLVTGLGVGVVTAAVSTIVQFRTLLSSSQNSVPKSDPPH